MTLLFAGDSRSRARVLFRAFDAEADAYSPDADAAGQKQLAQKKRGAELRPMCRPDGRRMPASNCSPQVARPTRHCHRSTRSCRGCRLCHGCQRPSLVRNPEGGRTTLDLSRREMADSTCGGGLRSTDYRRSGCREGGVRSSVPAGNCEIWVKSAVVEQGKQSEQPYRFNPPESCIGCNCHGAWVCRSGGDHAAVIGPIPGRRPGVPGV